MIRAPWLPPVISIMKRFRGRARRNREKFRAHGNSGECGLASPELRRRFVGRGDARHHAGEHAIRESGLRVRLKHDGRQSAQHGGEHHWAGSVSSHAERGAKLVAAKDRKRIPHCRDEFRRIARQFHSADPLEPRRANRLQNKPGLGHQSRFNSALRSDEHDFPFSFPRHPFPGDGERRKYMSTRAASCNQQFQALALARGFSSLRQTPGAAPQHVNPPAG